MCSFLQTEVPTYKRLRGLILRSQLIVLLQNKIFNENANTTWSNFNVDMNMFRKEYPRYPSIEEVSKMYLIIQLKLYYSYIHAKKMVNIQ